MMLFTWPKLSPITESPWTATIIHIGGALCGILSEQCPDMLRWKVMSQMCCRKNSAWKPDNLQQLEILFVRTAREMTENRTVNLRNSTVRCRWILRIGSSAPEKVRDNINHHTNHLLDGIHSYVAACHKFIPDAWIPQSLFSNESIQCLQ